MKDGQLGDVGPGVTVWCGDEGCGRHVSGERNEIVLVGWVNEELFHAHFREERRDGA